MNYLLTGVKNNYINNIYAVLFCKMGSLESMPGVMMARDMLYFFVWNAVKLRQMFSKAKEYKALRMIAHDVIVPPHLPSIGCCPPHTVGDWEDGDTIRGEWDEGRPATHEDSIRFGLI